MADRAGGIDLEIIEASGISGDFPEDDLRRGGAADISEANKQNADAGGVHGGLIGGNANRDNPNPDT